MYVIIMFYDFVHEIRQRSIVAQSARWIGSKFWQFFLCRNFAPNPLAKFRKIGKRLITPRITEEWTESFPKFAGIGGELTFTVMVVSYKTFIISFTFGWGRKVHYNQRINSHNWANNTKNSLLKALLSAFNNSWNNSLDYFNAFGTWTACEILLKFISTFNFQFHEIIISIFQ